MRVTRGTPTDEELAALVTVLLALPSPTVAAPPPASRWAASGRPRSGPAMRGPDAWRAAGLPQPR